MPTFEVSDAVFSEFEYMSKLLNKGDDNFTYETPEEIISFVLSSVADGSRRPGSWERQMLQMMGIVASADEHSEYRDAYGEPK